MAIQHLFGIIGDSNYRGNIVNLLETDDAPQTQTGGNSVADPISPLSYTYGSPWPILAQYLNDDYGIQSDYRNRSVGSTGMVDHIDNGKASTALVNIVSDLDALKASYIGSGDTVRGYVWCNWTNQDHNTTKQTDIGSTMQRYKDCIDYAFENGYGYVLAGNASPNYTGDLSATWEEEIGLPVLYQLAEEHRFNPNVLILTNLSERLGLYRGNQVGDTAHWSLPQARAVARRWANDIARQLLPLGV